MGTDGRYGLQEARQKRKYRNGFILCIAGCFALDDLFLSVTIALGGWYTIFACAFFLPLNALLVYLCYLAWTDPRYKRLRDKQKLRNHLHVHSVPNDPSQRNSVSAGEKIPH